MGKAHASTSTKDRNDRADNARTGQPVLYNRFGLDMLAYLFVQLVVADAVDSATDTIITAASHSAREGDVIRFTSGTYNGYTVSVFAVTTNTITLGQTLPAAPTAADTFDILRFRFPTLDSGGSITTSNGGSSSLTTEAQATIADTSTAVLAANSTRTTGTIRNIGGDDVYISLSGTATRVKPTLVKVGDEFELVRGGKVWQGAVSAITATAGATALLEVLEWS